MSSYRRIGPTYSAVSCSYQGEPIASIAPRLPRGVWDVECEAALIIANDTKYRKGGELLLLKYGVLDKLHGLATGVKEFAIMSNPQRGL